MNLLHRIRLGSCEVRRLNRASVHHSLILQFPFPQVTKNRFDGVLGRVPLDFVRESLSMSGFGRVLQPKKTSNFDNRRPEKLKATRLSGDVDVVRFSAPKMLGANKAVNKNTVISQPSPKKERVEDIADHNNVSSTTVTQHEESNERERGLKNTENMAGGSADGMSTEKKETVQRTVKKILSGTRLFTKAVNAPRNSNSRTDRQVKQNVTERQ